MAKGAPRFADRAIVSFAPLLDGAAFALAGWIAYRLRWDAWVMPVDHLAVLLLGTALVLVAFPLSGAYQSWRGRIQVLEFGHVFVALIAVGLVLVLLGALTKTSADYSRLWVAWWFLIASLLLFLSRLLFAWVDQHWLQPRLKTRQVLLVGTGKLAQLAADSINASAWPPMQVAGFVATGDDPGPALPAPLLGELAGLEGVLAAHPAIDEVWIALSLSDNSLIRQAMQALQRSALPIRYVPDLSILRLINHVPTEIAGLTVIDLNASPLSGQNILVKAVLDRVVAILVLALLWPVLLLIALAIKLDSRGPVLFRQARHGWDGNPIEVLKFRTMRQEEARREYRQATRGDPRVTRIGGWLRRTSLDELPQFINVLRGDMSVVGPRPHPLALNEEYVEQIDAYMQRHRVKPGITGWAQVNGYRGETDTLDKMKKRIEYDLYYIEHWSLWLDVKIMFRTLTFGWMGKNAY